MIEPYMNKVLFLIIIFAGTVYKDLLAISFGASLLIWDQIRDLREVLYLAAHSKAIEYVPKRVDISYWASTILSISIWILIGLRTLYYTYNS